jgi:hypothetical protein
MQMLTQDAGQVVIHWNAALRDKLQRQYDLAIRNERPQFTFDTGAGKHELVTAYAGYLLQYLNMQFGDRNATR